MTDGLAGSNILAYADPPADTVCLAALDESAPYEVDYTEIWRRDDTYILATASGCSCWSGEYETLEYSSLVELSIALIKEERTYGNPSVAECEKLLYDAILADHD